MLANEVKYICCTFVLKEVLKLNSIEIHVYYVRCICKLTCLNSSQPCHLNFAAKRINVQCFFKKRFKLYCMLHCFVKTTVRVFKTANFIFARCIDKWSCTAFNLNHLNTRKKKSDFKIQTLLNFLSSLLRAQRRTPLPSMITTDIGMSG